MKDRTCCMSFEKFFSDIPLFLALGTSKRKDELKTNVSGKNKTKKYQIKNPNKATTTTIIKQKWCLRFAQFDDITYTE